MAGQTGIRKSRHVFIRRAVAQITQPKPFDLREFLASIPKKPLSDPLLQSIRCNARTDFYFRTKKLFRVCELMARHHFLDPDALSLHGPDPYEFVFNLNEELRDHPDNEIRFFLEEFDFFRQGVISRELRCSRINSRDPLQSITTQQFFDEFVRDQSLRPKSAFLRSKKGEGGFLYFPHITPSLKILQGIAMLWETTKLNGHYEPGDMKTAPDLKDIDSKFGLPKRQVDVMTTIVRPLSARKGRRPKPYEQSESAVKPSTPNAKE